MEFLAKYKYGVHMNCLACILYVCGTYMLSIVTLLVRGECIMRIACGIENAAITTVCLRLRWVGIQADLFRMSLL